MTLALLACAYPLEDMDDLAVDRAVLLFGELTQPTVQIHVEPDHAAPGRLESKSATLGYDLMTSSDVASLVSNAKVVGFCRTAERSRYGVVVKVQQFQWDVLLAEAADSAVTFIDRQSVNRWHDHLELGTRPDHSSGFGSRRGRPAMSTGDAQSCTSAERYRPIPASRLLPEQPSSVGAALRAVRVAFWALRSAYTEYTAVGLAGLAFACVAQAWRGMIIATKTSLP